MWEHGNKLGSNKMNKERKLWTHTQAHKQTNKQHRYKHKQAHTHTQYTIDIRAPSYMTAVTTAVLDRD